MEHGVPNTTKNSKIFDYNVISKIFGTTDVTKPLIYRWLICFGVSMRVIWDESKSRNRDEDEDYYPRGGAL